MCVVQCVLSAQSEIMWEDADEKSNKMCTIMLGPHRMDSLKKAGVGEMQVRKRAKIIKTVKISMTD